MHTSWLAARCGLLMLNNEHLIENFAKNTHFDTLIDSLID